MATNQAESTPAHRSNSETHGAPQGRKIPIRNVARICRLGTLTAGLGIGATLAFTPGVAAADSSTEWFSSGDQLLSRLLDPAQATSASDVVETGGSSTEPFSLIHPWLLNPTESTPASDMAASTDPSTQPFPLIDQLPRSSSDPTTVPIQVSINGTDLFPTEDNGATAVSGPGNIAIAIGDGSQAIAFGGPFFGFFDTAFADGTDSSATSGLVGFLDFAVAVGDDSTSSAGVGGSLDTSLAVGKGSDAEAGGGNFDFATALGDMLHGDATDGNFLTDIAPLPPL